MERPESPAGSAERSILPALRVSLGTTVLVLIPVAVVIGVLASAAARDTVPVWPFALLVGATVVPVLAALWSPTPIMTSMRRALAVPRVAAPIVAVAQTITVLLPSVCAVIADARDPSGWHLLFDEEEGSLFAALIVSFAGNVLVAVLLALVLIPTFIVVGPQLVGFLLIPVAVVALVVAARTRRRAHPRLRD